MQTNEAYCTVTTGVVMKRNEAYQTVLRPLTPNLTHLTMRFYIKRMQLVSFSCTRKCLYFSYINCSTSSMVARTMQMQINETNEAAGVVS